MIKENAENAKFECKNFGALRKAKRGPFEMRYFEEDGLIPAAQKA